MVKTALTAGGVTYLCDGLTSSCRRVCIDGNWRDTTADDRYWMTVLCGSNVIQSPLLTTDDDVDRYEIVGIGDYLLMTTLLAWYCDIDDDRY